MGQAVLSDKDLIRGYLDGNEKSFEILLNRNKDRVFGYIMSKSEILI
jgi:RNA polymerase sigma-70 factor (ECF subfamily)